MNWKLVWDIRHAGTGDILIGLVIAGVIAIIAFTALWRARRRQQRSAVAKFLLVMATVMVVAVSILFWDRHRLSEYLERGEVQTIEGPVYGHQIWREERARRAGESQRYNTWETIYVSGVQFTWALDASEAAFTNTGDGKVAFQDGLRVRVRWVEDVPGEAHQRRIVALEIAADKPQQQEDAPEFKAPFPSKVDPYTLKPI